MLTATRVLQVLYALVILAAARGDLWLDEIWSLMFVEQVDTAVELFTDQKHDNNHLLNSIYLYVMGSGRPMMGYRMFSVLSGIGTLFLMGHLGRKWNPLAGFLAVNFTGLSYPLVLYASEARGYGPAIFFSLCAFWCLVDLLMENDTSKRPWFWLTAILAMLSHSSSFLVLLSMGAWFSCVVLLPPADWKKGLLNGVATFLIPVLVAVGLYLGFIREMGIGGGPVYSKIQVAYTVASFALGFPLQGVFPMLALGGFCVFLVAGSLHLKGDGTRLELFFPFVLAVFPVVIIWVTQPEVLYFRYFLLTFPFFYLHEYCSLRTNAEQTLQGSAGCNHRVSAADGCWPSGSDHRSMGDGAWAVPGCIGLHCGSHRSRGCDDRRRS